MVKQKLKMALAKVIQSVYAVGLGDMKGIQHVKRYCFNNLLSFSPLQCGPTWSNSRNVGQ